MVARASVITHLECSQNTSKKGRLYLRETSEGEFLLSYWPIGKEHTGATKYDSVEAATEAFFRFLKEAKEFEDFWWKMKINDIAKNPQCYERPGFRTGWSKKTYSVAIREYKQCCERWDKLAIDVEKEMVESGWIVKENAGT